MPTPSLMHVDTALTDTVIRSPMSQRYAADVIFPIKMVSKQSDKIFTLDPENEAFRDHDLRRAPFAEAKVFDFAVNSALTYFAEDHSADCPISDEEIANADVRFDRAELARDIVANNKEIELVLNLTTNLTGALTSTPGTKWDVAAGDAVGDIKAKKRALGTTALATPTHLVIDTDVLDAVMESTSVQSRLTPTLNPAAFNAQAGGDHGSAQALTLGAMLGLEVVVVDGKKNTAAKGQTMVGARIWGENVALVTVQAPNPNRYNGTGIQFVWSTGIGSGEIAIETIRNDLRGGFHNRAHQYYDFRIMRDSSRTAQISAHLFTNVLNASL